jgi:Flp pilus assembly protein TadD
VLFWCQDKNAPKEEWLSPSRRHKELIAMIMIAVALVLILVTSFGFWHKKDQEAVQVTVKLSKRILPPKATADLNLSLALHLVRDKHLPVAKRIYEEMLVGSPSNEGLLNNIAYVVGEMGDLKLAEEYLRTAIQVKANCAECLNNLGSIMHRAGKAEEARALYLKSLQLNDKSQDALLNLAVLCEEKGDWATARDV